MAETVTKKYVTERRVGFVFFFYLSLMFERVLLNYRPYFM